MEFASPFPQTPTPGGSATANSLNRPPLTSLKRFVYTPTPLPLNRKPTHPLSQVSMINSLSTIVDQSNSQNRKPSNLTLNNRNSTQIDQSLEADLLAFEREQKTHLHRPNINRRWSGVSDDHTNDDGPEQDDNTHQTQTTQASTNDEDNDSEFDEDSDSFRIGLSSLSPPGIGRSAPHADAHLSYQVGPDFSRDLSALSLSPIRRSSAPTPQRATTLDQDQDPSTDHQLSQVGQTPGSGFQGMARQLRRDFEYLTGIPSPIRSKKKKKATTTTTSTTSKNQPSAGLVTLHGSLPSKDGLRAKRVFGTELEQGLKPPRLHQLHSAGLTSTPPTKTHRSHSAQYDQNQKRGRNALVDVKNQPTSKAPLNQAYRPSIRIVEASSDVTNPPVGGDTSLPPEARKIVGNTIRVPDVTGLTDALRSPEKADLGSRNLPTAPQSSNDCAEPDPTLSEALSLLRRRLGFLEAENEACQTRIRDLQSQLNQAKHDPHQRIPSSGQDPRSVSQPAIEQMVHKLQVYTRRLNDSIEAHAIALDELNTFKTKNKHVRQDLRGVKSEVRQWSDEVEDMKNSLEGLTSEVKEIRNMIESLMKTTSQPVLPPGPSQPGMSRRASPPAISRINTLKGPLSKSQQEVKRNSRPQTFQHPIQSQQMRNDIEDWRSQTSTIRESRQSFIGPDEIKRLQRQVEQEQSIKLAHAPAQAPPKSVPTNTARADTSGSGTRAPHRVTQPTVGSSRAPPIRTSSAPNLNLTGNARPLKVTDEVLRGEAILNSLPKGRHDDISCSQCRLRRQRAGPNHTLSSRTTTNNNNLPITTGGTIPSKKDDPSDPDVHESSALPPQTVLIKILKDLEEDFETHRKIFIELSETYRKMDPASIQVSKRKALAQHLHESVDTLEKKAGHIKHLYDLLHVKDLPFKSTN